MTENEIKNADTSVIIARWIALKDQANQIIGQLKVVQTETLLIYNDLSGPRKMGDGHYILDGRDVFIDIGNAKLLITEPVFDDINVAIPANPKDKKL